MTIILACVSLLAGVAMLAGHMVVVSPQAVVLPQLEHAHLRMQLIMDGQSVRFGNERFQQHYAVCSDVLPEQPIHLHGHADQLVRLHWKGVTGGLILKNYGWNLIGGSDDALGYRFDRPPLVNRVAIFGKVLPKLPADTSFWVYSGDERSYKARSTQDFLQQDAETFFGTKSTVNAADANPLRGLPFAQAGAHESQTHAVPAVPASSAEPNVRSQAELARINNLLGNVVVFAQKDKPTDVQVAERFKNLTPLADSVCGG